MNTTRHLDATHSVLYQAPQGIPMRYFGWPTVARLTDGSLMAVASGFRLWHLCPFGRTVLWRSYDEGATWSEPSLLNDDPLDDRDAGVMSLPGGDALVSWFVSDLRSYLPKLPKEIQRDSAQVFAAYDEEIVRKSLGSFVRRIHADGTADAPIPVQVSAPHGPIRLHDGAILYVGIPFGRVDDNGKLHFAMENYLTNEVLAIRSDDEGRTWRTLGTIRPPADDIHFYEPHAVELPDGRLLCAIRSDPTTWLSESADGGLTWTEPRIIIEEGYPPHLLRHSSGVLVLSYGYRKAPFGQRIALSYDDGRSWETDWSLRDDGPAEFWDLGYPSTVELSDGSLYTVYYQKIAGGDFLEASILASHWTLPSKEKIKA